MPINYGRVFVNTLFVQNRVPGIDRAAAFRLGLTGAIVGGDSAAVGLILSDQLARREAPAEEQAPAVETVLLPNVVGKNVEDAKKNLIDSGVVDDVLVLRAESKKTTGEVIKQDPPANTPVPKGAKVTVTLTISTGPLSPPG